MEPKPTLRDWVESKRSQPPPPLPAGATAAHMLGIPEAGDEILGGKYRIERVIGLGGMGVVVSALHKKLGQRVAIKFLTAAMQTPELADRFIREGQAAVRIKSEHIAPVLDVGLLENGTPYLMMEHLVGGDLGEYLDHHGALPIEVAIDFILQSCDALAVAHSSGVIHRDLKPSNLFVTQRSDGSPLIKVLDFGISKIQSPSDQPDPKSTLTTPGMMLGSPRYMSPEQLRNASGVDHRSDIWTIGVVLHELVSGGPLFDADTFSALCAMIASEPPPRLRTVVPDAPEALEAIIVRCVEKNPANRFQNVAELASALAPLASSESRIIAARVGKILGYIPSKTPPGSYGPTKVSGTPKPADRTMPLLAPTSDRPAVDAPSDRPRVSSPMATTPVPGTHLGAGTPAPSSSRPSLPAAVPSASPSAFSALAISTAKPRKKGLRVGVIVAAATVFGVIALSYGLLRRAGSTIGTDPSAQPTPAPLPASSAAPSATATTAMTAVATTTATDEPAATAPATGALASAMPPAKTTSAPLQRRAGALPARPSASSAASVAPAATMSASPAAPQAPSEADMLNRRR